MFGEAGEFPKNIFVLRCGRRARSGARAISPRCPGLLSVLGSRPIASCFLCLQCNGSVMKLFPSPGDLRAQSLQHAVRTRASCASQAQGAGTSHAVRVALGHACVSSQLARLSLRIFRAWENDVCPCSSYGRNAAGSPCLPGEYQRGKTWSPLVAPGAHPKGSYNLGKLQFGVREEMRSRNSLAILSLTILSRNKNIPEMNRPQWASLIPSFPLPKEKKGNT